MQWVYLDNNATTQPADEVTAVMDEVNRTLWANPSSVHRFGQMVRQRVELARASVANLLHTRDRNIIFTSGGTESNNLALRGLLSDPNATHRVLITTKVEHSAIRSPADTLADLGVALHHLPVDRAGRVNVQGLTEALNEFAVEGAHVLVSVQWANNETGVIQPLDELLAIVREHRQREPGARILFHTDATQAVGKAIVDVTQTSVDLLTCASHKFHGPKGVGVLYVRQGVKVVPQSLGGPQERDRRGGTENTPGIIGTGVAADLAAKFVADTDAIERQRQRRDRFEKTICELLPGTIVNSGDAPRLWNTSNLGFPRLEAEAILLGLSEQGVCASAGAACSSGSLEPSPVLLAMGIPEPVAHGSVRFSLCRHTTDAEIDRAIDVVPTVVKRLMKTLPMSV